MRVDYARVSTTEQSIDAQPDWRLKCPSCHMLIKGASSSRQPDGSWKHKVWCRKCGEFPASQQELDRIDPWPLFDQGVYRPDPTKTPEYEARHAGTSTPLDATPHKPASNE